MLRIRGAIRPVFRRGTPVPGLALLSEDDYADAIPELRWYLDHSPDPQLVAKVDTALKQAEDHCANQAVNGTTAGPPQLSRAEALESRPALRRSAPGRSQWPDCASARSRSRRSLGAALRGPLDVGVGGGPADGQSQALLGGTPMAGSTGDGSSPSEEQALPEWAATPAWSSPRSTASASTPSIPRQTRWGSRGRRVRRAVGVDPAMAADGRRSRSV